jgi:hypothetical protein
MHSLLGTGPSVGLRYACEGVVLSALAREGGCLLAMGKRDGVG